MDLNALLTVSSIYLVLLGLVTLLFPTAVTAGSLAPASLVVTDILRSTAGAYLGGAIVNWIARKSEPSRGRDAIILGNTFGFSVASLFGILAVIQGFTIGGGVTVIISAIIANGFLIVGLSNLSNPLS